MNTITGPQNNVFQKTNSKPAVDGSFEIEGSNCPGLSRCTRTGNVDANEQITVNVMLKQQKDVPVPNGPFQSLDPKQAEAYHATREQINSVRNFASNSGLQVSLADPKTHTVKVTGTAASLSKAFGVQFGKYKDAQGNEFRGYTGAVKVPASMAGQVSGVLGLDNRPFAKPHVRMAGPHDAPDGGYTPPQVAALYNFPKNLDGSGQTIAIIELGGGYKDEDIKKYFQKLGIDAPNVQSVSVDGATNAPEGSPDSADGEVALDIEVAGGIAPKANILVYFAPNSDQGFIDAVNAAANADQKPAAISISWGAPEKEWSPQAMDAFNGAVKNAAALGVNVFAASGDNGSKDGENDKKNHADFPASSPFAIGCGGTQLNSQDGKITSEPAWNDGFFGGASGGGVSDHFPKPDYQANVNVPSSTSHKGGRGVPDVAGNASPMTGWDVIVDGSEMPLGGTSAVAPMYAGLAALLNQGVGGNAGFLNPVFYQHPDNFNDITEGNNGGFKAGPGWDPVTGLGSPDGTKLLNTLQSLKPQQPTPAPDPTPQPTPAPAPTPAPPTQR
jgi:kumamolisin